MEPPKGLRNSSSLDLKKEPLDRWYYLVLHLYGRVCRPTSLLSHSEFDFVDHGKDRRQRMTSRRIRKRLKQARKLEAKRLAKLRKAIAKQQMTCETSWLFGILKGDTQ